MNVFGKGKCLRRTKNYNLYTISSPKIDLFLNYFLIFFFYFCRDVFVLFSVAICILLIFTKCSFMQKVILAYIGCLLQTSQLKWLRYIRRETYDVSSCNSHYLAIIDEPRHISINKQKYVYTDTYNPHRFSIPEVWNYFF